MADTQTGTLSTGAEVNEKADEMLSPEERHRLEMKEQIERLATLGENPKIEAARLINNLESQQPWAKQFEGMTALQTALISVLEKLKGQAVDIKTVTIQSLPTYISLHGPEMDLNIAERVTVERLGEFSKGNAPKSLAAKLKSSWKETIETADRNWVEKSIDGIKKNPGKAMKTMLFAAAGIWAVSSLFSMIRGSQGKEEGTRDSFKTALMIGSLFLAGKLIGDWDKIFGAALAGRVQREIETMGKVSEETQKQVAEKGGKAVEELKKIQEGIEQEAGETFVEDEEGKSTVIDPEMNKKTEGMGYVGARNMFVRFCFINEKRNKDIHSIYNHAIDSISQVKLSKIQHVYDEYKDVGRIPTFAFKNLPEKITEEQLFRLIEKLISFKDLAKTSKADEDPTVKDMFENIYDNPTTERIGEFSNGLMEAVSTGDFSSAINSLGENGGTMMIESAQKMAERLDAVVTVDVESLSDSDKAAYRRMQTFVMTNKSTVKTSVEEVTQRILNTHSDLNKHPEAIKAFQKFYSDIQSKTEPLLKAAHERFAIIGSDGSDWLRSGVNFQTLKFFNACELVMLEGALSESGGEAANIAILGILIKSFNTEQAQNKYLGYLKEELTKDVDQIEIPGLKSIRPIIGQLIQAGATQFWYKFLGALQQESPNQIEHATAQSSEKMAERLTSGGVIQFGGEVYQEIKGTGFEITADSFAALIRTFDLEDYILELDTGEELLEILRLKGADVNTYEDRNGGRAIIINLGSELFFLRPSATLWETVKADNTQDRMRIWIGSCSFFCTAGFVRGFLKRASHPSGKTVFSIGSKLANGFFEFSKALAYPVTAPYKGGKMMLRGVQGLTSGGAGIVDTAKGTRDLGRRSWNWMKEFRTLGKSPSNAVLHSLRFEHHYERMQRWDLFELDLEDSAQYKGKGRWKRLYKKTMAGGKETLKTAGGLITDTKAETQKLLTGQYHIWMTRKGAAKSNATLTRLYDIDDVHALPSDPDLIFKTELAASKEASSRFNRLLDRARANSQHFRSIKNASGTKNGLETIQEILNKDLGLEPFEARAFAKRMNDPKKVGRIINSLEEGIKYRDKLRATGTLKRAARSTVSAIKGVASNGLSRMKKQINGTSKKPTAERVKSSPQSDSNTAKPTEASIKPALAAPAAALKSAQSNLAAVDRQIIAMQAEIMALHEASKKPGLNKEGMDELLEKALKANQRLTEAEKARATLRHSVGDLEKYASRVAEIEERLSNLNRYTTSGRRMAANLRSELESATLKANQALETATDAGREFKPSRFKALNEALKHSKGLKYALKGLGLGFAGWSTYEAVNAGREAWGIHDNSERAAYKWSQTGLLSANAALDTTALAGGALASKYAIAKTASRVAGRAAIPLVPITILGGTMLETAADDAKKDFEWAQTDPSVTLHNFATSTNSFSLGDAWMVSAAEVASWMTVNPTGNKMARLSDVVLKKRLEAKKETAHQIFRSLVAIQKDPSILHLIYDNELPKEERSKKIKDKIKAAYSEYHEFYFPEDLSAFKTYNYAEARSEILDAQLFDTIMSERDKSKKAGQPFLINGVDLTASDYDIPNGKGWRFESKHKRVEGETVFESVFTPNTIVDAYKKEIEKSLEVDPQVTKNMERMDTAYLLKLYVQISQAIREPKNKEDLGTLQEGSIKLGDYLVFQMTYIQNHLTLKRGIDFETAVRQAENFEPKMSLEQITQHLAGFMSPDNKMYLDYEKSNYRQTPAVHALHRLAEYFGYAGEPNEAKLKTFFSPELASFRGVYWTDGDLTQKKGWHLQEAGAEKDDHLGENLDAIMINKLATGMRHNKDDVLEHRLDQMGVSAYDQYESQVEKMAKMLEDGLDEGNERGYDTLSPFAINYEAKDENATEVLKQQFTDTIKAAKEKTGNALSQVNFEVKDEKTIEISRSDTGNSVELHRSGERWSVGEYYGDLTLLQAVALGNLKNFTEDWMKREGLTGDGTNPFEMNGNNIELNVNWNPINRTVISEKGLGKFYNEIGVTTKDVHEMLNNWHQMENSMIGKAKKAAKEAMSQRAV